MKKKAVALIVTSLMVVPAFAEKPAWAGNGKPTVEQREAHRKSMEGRDEIEGQRKEELEKQEKEKEKKLKKEKKERSEHMNDGEGDVDSQQLKGLEKQREKKSEQIQKELGKGSEEGLESRETRRKWWKFWGE
ncbi:MAG: hypothetical protein V7708_16420 [Oceanicoccus sp.]